MVPLKILYGSFEISEDILRNQKYPAIMFRIILRLVFNYIYFNHKFILSLDRLSIIDSFLLTFIVG